MKPNQPIDWRMESLLAKDAIEDFLCVAATRQPAVDSVAALDLLLCAAAFGLARRMGPEGARRRLAEIAEAAIQADGDYREHHPQERWQQ